MQEVLETYKYSQFPIDIEKIIYDLWLSIDYFNFKNINWTVYDKTIAIKDSLSLEDKRFTLWHELWHYLNWDYEASIGEFFKEAPWEVSADSFSRDILCPDYKVIELWNKFQNISVLARFF